MIQKIIKDKNLTEYFPSPLWCFPLRNFDCNDDCLACLSYPTVSHFSTWNWWSKNEYNILLPQSEISSSILKLGINISLIPQITAWDRQILLMYLTFDIHQYLCNFLNILLLDPKADVTSHLLFAHCLNPLNAETCLYILICILLYFSFKMLVAALNTSCY